MNREDHEATANAHKAAAMRCEQEWRKIFNAAIQKLEGRLPIPGDYRVSGIGRAEFDVSTKQALRQCCIDARQHLDQALRHRKASGRRASTSKRWLHQGRG